MTTRSPESPGRLRVAVFHPEPARRVEYINALRPLLPDGTELSDTADATTDYLVAWQPPRDVFDTATGLKACFSLGAGVDHLLRSGNLPDDLPLYRLEDAGMGDQMARYCHHEVEHFRLLCWRFAQQQQERVWAELEPREPDEVTVGLFGYGVLGRQVAQRLVNDGYPVCAYRRSPADASEDLDVYAGRAQLTPFLARCDVVILIAPLTDETRGIADSGFFDAMRRGSWMVNVARGELVNDEDLLNALSRNQLAGASLDVFHTEPLPTGHPYWASPQVRVTPHVAALTRLKDATEQIAGKLMQLQAGQHPSGLVERDRGY